MQNDSNNNPQNIITEEITGQYLNSSNFDAIVKKLDSIDAVQVLRIMGEEYEAESKKREPLALDLVREKYPDYYIGGSKEGQNFIHKGISYNVQITRKYDFGNISGTAQYNKLLRELAELDAKRKVCNEAIKASREAILLLHPDWPESKITVSLRVDRKSVREKLMAQQREAAAALAESETPDSEQ